MRRINYLLAIIFVSCNIKKFNLCYEFINYLLIKKFSKFDESFECNKIIRKFR